MTLMTLMTLKKQKEAAPGLKTPGAASIMNYELCIMNYELTSVASERTILSTLAYTRP